MPINNFDRNAYTRSITTSQTLQPGDYMILCNATAAGYTLTLPTWGDGGDHQVIFILSGTGAGQTNRITAYDGSTKVATVGTAWVTQPDNTSVYLVLGRVG